MEKIRVGFVGAGWVGPIHMEAVRRLGYPEIVGIAEIDKETAEDAAKKLNVPRAYSNWEELVNAPDIDVIHITCSNSLHFPISKACLEAGKAVICEKPLTLDLQEAKELVKLAKEKNIINATTFNMSFYPMVREAKEIIKRGELGKINLIYGRYMQDWLLFDTDYNWRVESKYQGSSRVLADIGSHWIQMIEMVSGKRIKSVFGDMSIFIPKRKKPLSRITTFQETKLGPEEYEEIVVDTEDHATVIFKFEDGSKGMIMAAQVCPGRKQCIEWELIGQKKSIAWNSEEPNKLWIGYRDKSNEIFMKDPSLMSTDSKKYSIFSAGLTEGYGDTWKNMMESIYQCIRDGGNKKNIKIEFPTFEDGCRIMSIIDSILKSVKEEKWINVE